MRFTLGSFWIAQYWRPRLLVCLLVLFCGWSAASEAAVQDAADNDGAEIKDDRAPLSLDDLFVNPDGIMAVSTPQGGDAIVPRKAWENDFDDADSPGDFPLRYWVRMTKSADWPGHEFPSWNTTAYEPRHPVAGAQIPRVFELSVRGGNAGIRLVDGVISAIPLTDYLVRLKIRTVEATRARALVLARFLDERGKPIQGSTEQTVPLDTKGQWETVTLTLTGQYPKATWIQIDILLVQPTLWAGGRKYRQAVQFEDVRARVQLDDLTVWRLPRIELQASASNAIVDPELVKIHYRLQDMASRYLQATMQVLDIRGVVVDETTFAVKQPAVVGVWEPRVPKFGWYRAVLVLEERGTPVARATTEFAYLPAARRDLRFESNPREFSTILSAQPAERTTLVLNDLLNALGAGRVNIPIWEPGLTELSLRSGESRLAQLIENALGENRAIDINLDYLPDELAKLLDTDRVQVLAALTGDFLHTPKYLENFLIRFGQRADRWLIGAPFNEELTAQRSIAEVVNLLDAMISRFVPRPSLLLAYPGDYVLPTAALLNGAIPAGSNSATAIANSADPASPRVLPGRGSSRINHFLLRSLPAAIRPGGIPQFVAEGSELLRQTTVLLEPIAAEEFGELGAMQDLAKRAILCREAGISELALMQPWREIGRIRPRPAPQATFPVWRTLREQLAGRKPEGRLALGRGLVGIIFADTDRADGTVACWSESPTEAVQTVRLYLGQNPVEQVDIFGNRTAIPFDGQKHLLTIGAEPIFLEGVDIRLAIFRSSLALDSNFVEVAAVRNRHQVVLRNPWPKQIDGTIRLTNPESWQFQPRYLTFSISPGEEIRLPVALTIPIFETAGAQQITANIALEAGRSYNLDTAFPIELGHRTISIRPTYAIIPDRDGADDLVVTLELTNRGEERFALRAFVIAAIESGFPYLTTDIPSLEGGETVEQAFHFRDGAELLRGTTLRVGFRGMETTDRLNLLLKID